MPTASITSNSDRCNSFPRQHPCPCEPAVPLSSFYDPFRCFNNSLRGAKKLNYYLRYGAGNFVRHMRASRYEPHYHDRDIENYKIRYVCLFQVYMPVWANYSILLKVMSVAIAIPIIIRMIDGRRSICRCCSLQSECSTGACRKMRSFDFCSASKREQELTYKQMLEKR